MATPLRIERKKRNWTTTQVAQALDIDPSQYCKIELGKLRATPQLAERIARHLGYAISEIQILYPERFPQSEEPEAAA